MENQIYSNSLPVEAREKILAALTGKDSAFIDIARLRARLRIRVLNRAGDYACVLVPKKNRGAQWDKFAEAGKAFGIFPNQLEHLAERAEKRIKRQGLPHHDALHATP